MTINKITESEIENYSLDEIKQLGFSYISSLLCCTLLLKLSNGEAEDRL